MDLLNRQASLANASFRELVQYDRVHRLIYIDPQIFALEMDRIFSKSWVYVGHESEVAQPGDYKSTTIGVQPVVMTRHRDGDIYLLFNRCAHRGAVVCREERGTSSYFRCLYHGWTYNNDGTLLGVPHRPGYGPDFRTEELGLGRVPRVESYRGFVFASLNPDVESLLSYLGQARYYMDLILDWSPEGEIEVTRTPTKYRYGANWKLHLENWADNYHPGFTHEAQFEVFRTRTGVSHARADDGVENVYLGHGHAAIDFGDEERSPRADAEHRAALERRLGPERARMVLESGLNLVVFPNLLFRTGGPYFLVIQPVRVDETEMLGYRYRLKGPAEEYNRRATRAAPTAASTVQTDDLEAFERIDEGLRVQSMEWVLFNRGLHRERALPNGEIRGLGADEVGNRGQHLEYLRLMLEEPRRCCGPAGCAGAQAEMERVRP
jgi:phenylpropionate dioxygenase-like ring-hydroxylating dioxygenase large terminal subunit